MKPIEGCVLLTLIQSSAALCKLNCENGGYCENIPLQDVAKAVRSGAMVERCVCPTGEDGERLFIGTGCEISLHGAAEEVKGLDDCSILDFLNPLAGRMCRRLYTDYCSSQVRESSPYCTNGGKCRGDLISASIAPGDTSANTLYENMGCICPRDFYGPHCEFLHHHNIEARIKQGLEQRTPPPKSAGLLVDVRGREKDQGDGDDHSERPNEPSRTVAGMNKTQIEDLLNESVDHQTSSGKRFSVYSQKLHFMWIPLGLALVSVCVSAAFYANRRARRHQRLLEVVEKAAVSEQDHSNTTEYSVSERFAQFVIPEDMSISENQVRSFVSSNDTSLPYSFSESEDSSLCTTFSSLLKYFI